MPYIINLLLLRDGQQLEYTIKLDYFAAYIALQSN